MWFIVNLFTYIWKCRSVSVKKMLNIRDSGSAVFKLQNCYNLWFAVPPYLQFRVSMVGYYMWTSVKYIQHSRILIILKYLLPMLFRLLYRVGNQTVRLVEICILFELDGELHNPHYRVFSNNVALNQWKTGIHRYNLSVSEFRGIPYIHYCLVILHFHVVWSVFFKLLFHIRMFFFLEKMKDEMDTSRNLIKWESWISREYLYSYSRDGRWTCETKRDGHETWQKMEDEHIREICATHFGNFDHFLNILLQRNPIDHLSKAAWLLPSVCNVKTSISSIVHASAMQSSKELAVNCPTLYN